MTDEPTGAAMNDRPLVSTIIPVYNRATMLAKAVNSVLAQTWRPIEIIVVDDASTDDTPQVIADLAQKHQEIRAVKRTANGGAGAARESGRQAARGDYIQYLDSDDIILPRKFELQLEAFGSSPEAGVAYGLTRYRDRNGEEIECWWKPANQRQSSMFPSMLACRWWDTFTPLYRRSVTDAAGPWSDLRLEEDWEYDCRVAALGTRLAFVPQVLAEYQDHGDDRLSAGDPLDPWRLSERARAHELILRTAQSAGITSDIPEMKHFARELFLLARQSGAAGLPDLSRHLFELAVEASGPDRSRPRLTAYRIAAGVIGWQAAGKLAAALDRLRSGGSPGGRER